MKYIVSRTDQDMFLVHVDGDWSDNIKDAVTFLTERAATFAAAEVLVINRKLLLNNLQVLKAPEYCIQDGMMALCRDGEFCHPKNTNLLFSTRLQASNYLCKWAPLCKRLFTDFTIEEI